MMKTLSQAVTVVLLFLISTLFSVSLAAQSGDPIGRVLLTKGSVQAVAQNGQTRTLSRRSELFEEDRIITGPNGFAQIRMVDNAIIALKEDTEFAFNEYTFDGNPNTGDSAVMELVRGGFRTISGSISDGADDTYRVDTAFASIGVRGTNHEAVIDLNSLFTGVYDGGTTVSNNMGSVDTGLDANFDYSQTVQGQAPQGLLQQPNQLGRINFNPGIGDNGDGDDGGDGDQGDDGGDDGAGGDGGAGNDGNDGGAAGDGNNVDGNTQGGGDDGGTPNFNNQGAGGGTTTPPPVNPGGNNQGGGNNNGGGNTNPAPGANTDAAINPTQNVQKTSDITNAGQNIPDTDGDGVPDNLDAFPNNPAESKDTDGDGVGDNSDAFPNDPQESRDTDGDGVGDNSDAFPTDPAESKDTDGDGVGDSFDAFPNDPLETTDTDGDGVGDNSDAFPNDPLETMDTDGDGVGDNSDAFPDDPLETVDTDGDGVGDNADAFPDDPTKSEPEGGSGGNDGDGTGNALDSDGDGIPDSEDAFPNDPLEWADTDGDGYGDNNDAFPDDPNEHLDSDGDGIGDNSDPTPDGQPVGPVVVLNQAQYNSIVNGVRRGFTLSRNFVPYNDGAPVIFFGPSSDGGSGNPIIITDRVDVEGSIQEVTVEDDDFIFDSIGSVASQTLGFTNGIPSFYGDFTHNVQWGAWGPSQALRIYNNVDDNSTYVSPPIMLWVSANYTDLSIYEVAISTGEEFLYLGDQNFIGGSTIGGLTDLFARFNLNLASGVLNDGHMEFCLGGDCDSYENGSQYWEFDFDADIDFDTSTIYGQPVSSSGDITFLQEDYGIVNEGTDIYGVIDGLFTGSELEAFAGGLSLYSDPSMYTPIEAAVVDAIFLLEREDRFTNLEADAMKDALFVQEDFGHNLLGYGVPTGGLPAKVVFIDDTVPNPFVPDILPASFIDRPSRFVFRVSDEEYFTIGNVNLNYGGPDLCGDSFPCDIDHYPYGVKWEFWDGPLATFHDNYDLSDNEDTFESGGREAAFYATFDIGRANNLRGHFSDVLGFLGQGDEESPITALTMDFDVDFQVGSIFDGIMTIEVGASDPGEIWYVYFDSDDDAIQGNRISDINILPSDGEGNQTRLDDNGTIITTITGSINGAFVDDNTPYSTDELEQAFVSSFYFQDTAGIQTVQGIALVGGQPENRFSFAEEDSLFNIDGNVERLGLVMPTHTELGTGTALASLNSSNPLFVSNYIDDEEYGPFDLPDPFDTDWVIKNQSASNSSYTTDYDVIFGNWSVDSEGDVVSYEDNVNLYDAIEFTDDVFWATVESDILQEDPWYGLWNGNQFFFKTLDFQGSALVDEDGELTTADFNYAEGLLEVDFDSGTIIYGQILLCAGGSGGAGECTDDATKFEISFDEGTYDDGVFTSGPISQIKVGFDGEAVPMDVVGSVSGIFTSPNLIDQFCDGDCEEAYDAVVFGFNFIEDENEDNFLSGNVIVQRDDRLITQDVEDLELSEYDAIVINSEFRSPDFFVSSGPAENVDPQSIIFYAKDISIPESGEGGGYIDTSAVIRANPVEYATIEKNKVLDVGTFNLGWGIWENALYLVDEDTLINGDEDYDDEWEPDLIWASFKGDNPDIKNLVGIYNSDAGYFIGGQGSLSDDSLNVEDPLDEVDISFIVNLFSGIVSNGYFHAEVDTGDAEFPDIHSWELDEFGGVIEDRNIKFFDQASGEGSPVLGTYNYDDQDNDVSGSMIGSFVDRNSWNEFEHGEGILVAFSLNAKDGADTWLDGLTLTEVDYYDFLDLRYFDIPGFPFLGEDDLPISNTIPDPFVDLGFILASNHDAVTITNTGNFTHEFVFPAMVAFEDDGVTPAFLEVRPEELTLPPEPDVVFRLNGGDQFRENPSTDYPNVVWGYWDDGETEDPAAFIAKDLSTYEDDFERLYWAVVTAPGFSGPPGIFTYARRVSDLSMTQTNSESNVTDLFVTFDVDFLSGSVDNGFLRVCVDGTGGCDGATRWESDFTGDVSYGTLTIDDSDPDAYLQPFGLGGDIIAPDGSNDGSFGGDLNGVFTGYSNYNDPYDVFVGGLNLFEVEGSRFVSGLFLTERDDRLDPGQDTGSAELFASLNNLQSRAMMTNLSYSILTGLKSSSTLLLDDYIFFQDPASGDIFQLPDFFTHSLGSGQAYSDDYFQLGYWEDGVEEDIIRFFDNLDTENSLNFRDEGGQYLLPVAWANITDPIDDFGFPVGLFTSDSGSDWVGNLWDDEIDYGINDFEMSFLVNFGNGVISDGSFRLGEWYCECEPYWFEGDLSGNVATVGTTGFTVSDGSFVYLEYDNEFEEWYTVDNALDVSEIAGEFTGNPQSDETAFAGVFNLKSSIAGAQAIGSFAIAGLMEDRLSYSDMQAMKNNLGLLVDTSTGNITPVFSNSSTADSPVFGHIADYWDAFPDGDWPIYNFDTGQEDIGKALATNELDPVIVENGSGSLNEQTDETFNVGWGYWATGADSLENRLDGDSVTNQGFSANPLYWLSAEPGDIADMDAHFIDYFYGNNGMGTDDLDNTFDTFDMNFYVDLAGGTISNGFLQVITTAGTWGANFDGELAGAYAVMDNITGNYTLTDTTSTSITGGDIQGIFTGTGSNPGFATGFFLEDGTHSVSGVGLLDGMVE